MNGAELIKQERERQTQAEGWSAKHDDEHERGELALMGAAYALSTYTEKDMAVEVIDEVFCYFGDSTWFKPKDPMRNLVRAGALIAAEIDRRQRLTEKR